jgi:hypothetical protein
MLKIETINGVFSVRKLQAAPVVGEASVRRQTLRVGGALPLALRSENR